ncbi:MAG TPA: MGMT family protein [Flavobacteriales bacterium]|nr:MGMT family protein [Flavobacteriales bacterium]
MAKAKRTEKEFKTEDDFFKNVWAVVRLIPKGRVTSYGAIAKYLGAAGSSRMVGWAMNASHKQKNLPAHRVVNRVGLLSGKHNFGPGNEMKNRLEKEGIKVKKDMVVDFKKLFWDPMLELEL